MSRTVIVVPVYNGESCIRQCIEQALDNAQIDCVVAAVDNASSDASVGVLENLQGERPDNVHLIKNEANVGFPGACNQGIRWALEQGAEHVVLLNQDAFACDGWLKELTAAADLDSSLGAVQAMVLLETEGEPRINTAGNPMNFLGYSWCGSFGAPAPDSSETGPAEVPIGSGAALLVTREALETCGMLEDSFFLYHEDTDLCWRIRLAGYRIALAPEARVVHRYSPSTSSSKFCFAERNRWMLLLRTASWRRLLVSSPLLVASALAAMVVAAKNGWLTAFVKSQTYLLRHFGEIISARRRIQSTRRIRERDLARWLCAEIDTLGMLPARLQRAANSILRGYWGVARRLL